MWKWLIVLVACSGIPALPSQGGPAWTELSSPHFTLWTDASPERANALMTEMEHLRQIVVGIGFRGVAKDSRVFVIAVRDFYEFRAYAPDEAAGLAIAPAAKSSLRQLLMILPAETNDAAQEIIETHELTHVISYCVIRQQPRWFAEGLAYYFETLRHDARGVSIGFLPHIAGEKRTTLASMRACTGGACSGNGQFVVTAWRLFDFLLNNHPAELENYIDLLASGRGDDAFDEVFTTPLEQLEREMSEWARKGRANVRHYDVTYLPFSVKTRVLAEADVLAARAILESIGDSSERALTAIDATLKQQPTNPIANMLATKLGRAITPTAATAIAAAHPDDWRAWWLVEQAGGDPSAHDKACALVAGNPAIDIGACPPAAPAASQGP